MREAEQMPESMRGSIYIGSTGARAYLESWRMSIFDERGRTTVYWTEVSGLPDGWLEKVKPGR